LPGQNHFVATNILSIWLFYFKKKGSLVDLRDKPKMEDGMTNLFNKVPLLALSVIFSSLLVLLVIPASYAETATVEDDCAKMTITSSDPDVNGDYYLEMEGVMVDSYYYFAAIFMNDNLMDYDSSFFSTSFSASYGPYSDEHTFRLEMRGHGAMNICVSSLELTAGGGKKDPVKMSNDICSAIKELDNDAFKNNPMQRKNALCNKLSEVATLTGYAEDSSDPIIKSQFYVDAIEKVSKDIGAKMDSNYGGQSKNDWIISSDAQSELFPMVEELRTTLQDLL